MDSSYTSFSEDRMLRVALILLLSGVATPPPEISPAPAPAPTPTATPVRPPPATFERVLDTSILQMKQVVVPPGFACAEAPVLVVAYARLVGECVTSLNITQPEGTEPARNVLIPPGADRDRLLEAFGASRKGVLEAALVEIMPDEHKGGRAGKGYVIEYNVICEGGTASTTKITKRCKRPGER